MNKGLAFWRRGDATPEGAPRPQRPHPYANEASAPEETESMQRKILWTWGAGSLIMIALGLYLSATYGYTDNDTTVHPDYPAWTLIGLFPGIVLLMAGLVDRPWARKATMVGWVLFASYFAMSARDLFVREENDYVNSIGAALAVLVLNYFSYQEWLSLKRGVYNAAMRYVSIVAVIAAGSYFAIAKIAFIRIPLIKFVGAQTKGVLDWFGLGNKLGLQFHIDEFDSQGPVLFHYPDTYCDPYRADPIGDYCATLPPGDRSVLVSAGPAETFWDQILLYAPDGDLRIIPVSIILACTAIQTIMLFVGLFMGAEAPLAKRLKFSVVVGALIYVLNLLRNTMVIAAYGRGLMSFWFVHNFLAKILTLSALLGIAYVCFKWFPEFFRSLGGLLDLKDRDGPLERALKIGRRRPEPTFPGES